MHAFIYAYAPPSERSEDIVCGIAADIVHAQRGFRRRKRGDIVNRFTEGEALPMDWEEDMQLPTGNEIRFADEILPHGQDEIGTLSRRNPLLWSERSPQTTSIKKPVPPKH